MPAIVHDYNQHRVVLTYSTPAWLGTDLVWFLGGGTYYLFWPYVLVGIVNAWNLYRREYRLWGLPRKSTRNHRRYQAQLASGLVAVNVEKRRGMYATEENSPTPHTPRVVWRGPVNDVCTDNYFHWPGKVEKRGRCEQRIKNNTNIACTKCDVRLCFTEKRKCFRSHHV